MTQLALGEIFASSGVIKVAMNCLSVKPLRTIMKKVSYKKNENITAGFKVTVEDLQLDATVDNQLRHFKSSVLG